MQLQKFDSTNLDSRRRKYISKVIISRTGFFRLAKSFCMAAKLKKGSRIAMLQDKNEPRNWYISVDPENGLTLRDGRNGGLCFNSIDLRDKIINSVGETLPNVSYAIATVPEKINGMELYTIITANNRKKIK